MVLLCSLRCVALAAGAWLASSEFKAIDFLPDVADCSATLTTPVHFECKGKLARDQKYDVWKTSLDFHFGLLAEEEWVTLRQQYTAPWAGIGIFSGWTPLFDGYDGEHQYSIKDFLPPTIRALDGYNFVEEDEALPAGVPLPPAPPSAPRVYNQTILVPNCWATVCELLRTIAQCRMDMTTVYHDVYSTDDKDAQRWAEEATTIVPGPYTAADRRFGDVMLVFLRDPQMKRAILQHAVIFVDQDIVFEKAGSGSKNPYRLIDLTTVEKEWKPTLQGGLFEWVLHRPLLRNEHQKSFAEQFSLLSMDVDERWPQFWQWPKELQATHTLGRSDNPRNPEEGVLGLTVMKARRYALKKTGSDWAPLLVSVPRVQDSVVV